MPGINLQTLSKYSAVYPVGGDVQLKPAEPGETATIQFTFKTSHTGSKGFTTTNSSNSDDNLLMLAFPHHMDAIRNASTASLLGIRSTKGPMTGIVDTKWVMPESVNSLGFFGPNKIDPEYRSLLVNFLRKEANSNITTIEERDPYFFGKGIAKIARLILIAEELDEYKIRSNLTRHLQNIMEPWVNAQNDDPLCHETLWGGIVSKNGTTDVSVDFGNAYYNDHHFHYGYFINAGAVLSRVDPAWGKETSKFMTTLLRDYVNPSRRDKDFTSLMREFDFYDGKFWKD